MAVGQRDRWRNGMWRAFRRRLARALGKNPIGGATRVSLGEAAQGLGWELDGPTRAFLRSLRVAMDQRPTPARVAILTASKDDRLSVVIARARPRALVTVINGPVDPSTLHVTLAASGPFDVVVDSSLRERGQAQLFRRCFPHLRPGGSYIVRQVRDASSPLNGRSNVLALAVRLLDLRTNVPESNQRRYEHDDVSLARKVGDVAVHKQHLVVRCRLRAWAKLTEMEMDKFLHVRGESVGRVLVRLSPTVFTSQGVTQQSPLFREGPPSRQEPFPELYDVPALSLREYHDVICLHSQVALLDNVVLPDSYRKNQKRRLRSHRILDVGPVFGVPRRMPTSVHSLEGPFFYLDSEYRGHFGHAMTEQLSRLWAWDEAKRMEPRLQALMCATPRSNRLKEFERTLFAAAGLNPKDLVLVDGPVRVAQLFAATPMFSQPHYVHPDIRDLWARVGSALADAAPNREYPRRVFCARRGLARSCRNPDDVEAMFSTEGFEVIYPEDFSLPEQARIFQTAEIIAGYAGSALFNICLSGRPKHVVMIAPDSYIARNEHLMSSVLGHRLDVIWSASEVPMPHDGFSREAFTSGFTFDVKREGQYLRAIFADLAP